MYAKILIGLLLLFGISFNSCDSSQSEYLRFPEINHPEDNLPSKERIQLGEKMFFSTIFSSDSSKSCASCHIPKFAFSDTVPFSFGVKGRIGTRNAPSLLNVGFKEKFLRDGIVPTLEKQVSIPIHEHNEFDFNIVLLADRMNQDSSWVQMAQKAYGRDPDPFVITRSLGAFQRTLISSTSPYDHYINGNKNALTEEQKKGMELFNGKANCSKCHSEILFTDESLRNNGLYEKYVDSGKMRLTLLEEDRAMFKVPSLRNVTVTGPYMHDGSLITLEEVIEHYNSGGKQHKSKSDEIKALNLTIKEKQQLVDFLKSLTDYKTINLYDKKYASFE